VISLACLGKSYKAVSAFILKSDICLIALTDVNNGMYSLSNRYLDIHLSPKTNMSEGDEVCTTCAKFRDCSILGKGIF
jgi:hypothetical protein